MDTAAIIGYLASICSMTSFAPQAWKIIKTRDTSAISAGMYSVTVAGFAFWTAFGVLKWEWPIIVTNAVCFCFSAFILAMTLLPKRERDEVADKLSGEG